MRWNPGRMSDNVEDVRERSGGRRFGGPRLGLGAILVLLVLSLVFKRDFFSLIGAGGGLPAGAGSGTALTPQQQLHEDSLASFVSAVLDSTQREWATMFPKLGGEYRDAKLVLFRDAMQSACGGGGVGHRAVLLPRGREGLHRPGLLRRAHQPLRRGR